jgi:Na+/proline symporter
MSIYTLISLAAYFVLMMGIGYYAYLKSTSDVSEYMLGGRQLHPAVGALSAGASDMSGWMLMGLPGAIFVAGLQRGVDRRRPGDRRLPQLSPRSAAPARVHRGC